MCMLATAIYRSSCTLFFFLHLHVIMTGNCNENVTGMYDVFKLKGVEKSVSHHVAVRTD